jgi:uncharacterized protein YeaO (DUF488 family)
MRIETQRVYEDARGTRGFRVLVDRLWPRGLRKDQVHFDIWLKDIAPSATLRAWFGHDPVKWQEFKRRYFRELAREEETIDRLIALAGERTVVLLYGARDTEHNQAIALKEYMEKIAVKV